MIAIFNLFFKYYLTYQVNISNLDTYPRGVYLEEVRG